MRRREQRRIRCHGTGARRSTCAGSGTCARSGTCSYACPVPATAIFTTTAAAGLLILGAA
jgi:hypothetical protein